MKTTDKKTADKKSGLDELLRGFAMLLAEIHPRLPAYFCARSGALVPIASGEDADEKMAKLGLKRIDPDGHIDNDVLWAIYELFAEADGGLFPVYHPQIALSLVRKALHNKNSKLSIAIAKAYGEAQ